MALLLLFCRLLDDWDNHRFILLKLAAQFI